MEWNKNSVLVVHLVPSFFHLNEAMKLLLQVQYRESYGVTIINNVTAYNTISSNNTLPDPQVITTGEIGLLGDGEVAKEEWESVLVEYDNVNITSYYADGGSNLGEILVNDGTGDTRVELEDGSNSYHNGSGQPGTILVELGAHFQKLKGIMYYSFSNYKLVPRKDDDFVGYTTAVREENSNPVSFSLEQNYPNPFNPSTRIVYSIPKASNVTLNIYNVLGQQVKTLFYETQSQGTYTVSFNATSLPSGIYFYRIDAGDYSRKRK